MAYGLLDAVRTYLIKHPWMPVLTLDIAILPGFYFAKWLIDFMFATGKPCKWTLVGLKCATCGGTHCVQSFLQADFAESFLHNPMVFCWIFYGLLTILLLNLRYLGNLKFAGKILGIMYSLKAFLAGVAVFFLYTFLRNLPFLIALIF